MAERGRTKFRAPEPLRGASVCLVDGRRVDIPRSGFLALPGRRPAAVFEGAAALLDKVRAAAARRLGCQATEIEITYGAAGTRDGRSVALAELAQDGLKVDASFENHHRHPYAYGTAAAQRMAALTASTVSTGSLGHAQSREN
jgi:hypothetical protein